MDSHHHCVQTCLLKEKPQITVFPPRYLVFSDSENRDIYLNDPVGNSKLLLGTFDAPFNYSAKIILNTPTYNTITLGSNGNVINFNVDILNKEGLSTGENILCTYTFRRGSVTESISE